MKQTGQAISNTETQSNQSTYRPLHELSPCELAVFRITPDSRYSDTEWFCQSTTPGRRTTDTKINWAFFLFDESRLTDQRHTTRLSWAKKLMALILTSPASGIVPSPSTIPLFQQGFKWLISWMAARGLQHPEEIDTQTYIENLPQYISEQNDDDEITITHGTSCLYILRWLWSERRLMNKWGVRTLPYNPFYEHGIDYFARAISTKAKGWIPPLPDEISIPLFNKAAWFLDKPAEDVICLLQYIEDPLAGTEVVIDRSYSNLGFSKRKAGVKKEARLKRSNNFLAHFSFNAVQDNVNPWHPPLDLNYETEYGIKPTERVRILFEAIRESCVFCIQGLSGMRISELLGIESGYDSETALPLGVRIETSATGLYEVFLINTVLSKTESGLPRKMDWVLGMRPKGSNDEPLPVRALRILNHLHEPWRDRASTRQLLLASGVGCVLPLKHTSLGPMSSNSLRDAMKRFITRWVDLTLLPNESKHKVSDNDLVPWRESKGLVFKSHMLRKSWAQFMFAVDPKLLPAIQLQFHHLSLSMTDTGYIGSNPLIVADMSSIATQSRNLLILETVLGLNPLAGKMGEHLEHATLELADQVKNIPVSEAYAKVVAFCEHNRLPIFFSPHGACMPVQTHEMRCHEETGTSLLLRVQPNARTRQPSLCAGCACFVLDGRHADFWASRYMDNWIAYKRAERDGDTMGFKVIKERAQQAGKLLKKLDFNVILLDNLIQDTLEKDNAIT
ncbi:hypothetical protein [Chitinimonas sp. JJ19]|uniref:hypothetical protein n=1 Tax=Chitinimonas sp. JJ19 TaxID=3109352 RepID=UPI0030028A49